MARATGPTHWAGTHNPRRTPNRRPSPLPPKTFEPSYDNMTPVHELATNKIQMKSEIRNPTAEIQIGEWAPHHGRIPRKGHSPARQPHVPGIKSQTPIGNPDSSAYLRVAERRRVAGPGSDIKSAISNRQSAIENASFPFSSLPLPATKSSGGTSPPHYDPGPRRTPAAFRR